MENITNSEEKAKILEFGTIRSSENIGELALALSSAQGELAHAKKSSTNPFFKSKYADLSEVIDTYREVLSRNKIALLQYAENDNNKIMVTTKLVHGGSGQWTMSTLSIIAQKNDVQTAGSCITYLRRYGVSAILGISTEEDDDGNSVSHQTNSIAYITKEQVYELMKLLEYKPEKEVELRKKYKIFDTIPAQNFDKIVKYINS